MKVYVVYEERPYDGYSLPLRAFSTEEGADKFCRECQESVRKDMKARGLEGWDGSYDYEELEVEG